eukprot:gene22097-29154_t
MEPELLQVAVEEYDNKLEPESTKLRRGKFEGHGKVVLRSGVAYEGNWSEGSMHGKGLMTFPDGLLYEGDFLNSTITGTGVYCWTDGGRYEGEVVNGKRHGTGTMSFQGSETVYEGEWSGGMRHGKGTIYFNAERTNFYEGEWVSDMKEGQGLMQYDNTDVYEGEWVADLKCGQGTMKWLSVQQQYTGQWKDNMPHGVGTHTWFQQVAEPSPANHALLLMFNRHYGHFIHGQRTGYGVLFYATGARYEGMWLADKKEGPGCFVFENGENWLGSFQDDRPVLADGERFAPKSINNTLNVVDLLEEEEVLAVAVRSVNNVLMVYNTDLRSLYDKYCKRPSLHMPRGEARPSFTMVSAQFWELLLDSRLVTIDEILALARQPSETLAAFREKMQVDVGVVGDEVEEAFWLTLTPGQTEAGGIHNPMLELLFPSFCQALVRTAAVRYHHLPGLERRVHTLINTHLLASVVKNKTVPQPPQHEYHTALWSNDSALEFLQQNEPNVRRLFHHLASIASIDGGGEVEEECSLETGSLEHYRWAVHPRAVLKLLMQLEELIHPKAKVVEQESQEGAGDGSEAIGEPPVEGEVAKEQVKEQIAAEQTATAESEASNPRLLIAAALCFHYMGRNLYGHHISRLRMEGDLEDGVQVESWPSSSESIEESDEREMACWLDVEMVYPEFIDALIRLAHLRHISLDSLSGRLRALLEGDDIDKGLLVAFELLLAPPVEEVEESRETAEQVKNVVDV